MEKICATILEREGPLLGRALVGKRKGEGFGKEERARSTSAKGQSDGVTCGRRRHQKYRFSPNDPTRFIAAPLRDVVEWRGPLAEHLFTREPHSGPQSHPPRGGRGMRGGGGSFLWT